MQLMLPPLVVVSGDAALGDTAASAALSKEDQMQIIVWAGLFLLLSVVGSTITLAGMVGMPIANAVQAGLLATAALVAGLGIVLSAAARRTAQQRVASR